MPRSGIQEWWRSQLDAPRRTSSSPHLPICPCASCFNGTAHGSTNESRYSKHHTAPKKFNGFASRESVASDMVPLCSDAASASCLSLESHSQAEKKA
ncbi:hypothetical protein F4859DRAFT_515194 [Xylaria cf. heliscus]|nr:hypothetical protein F4859DRAFT_515194 [Xylaria cf. heliscus]